MAEVCAIVNNRPIVNVSTDPENPFILSPATILTQKVAIDHVEDSVGEIDTKDLLKIEWKRVSALSEIFWNRWKKKYLHTLQERRQWCCAKPSLTEGDVVLLKDRSVCRTQWPYGIVVRAIQSEDGKIWASHTLFTSHHVHAHAYVYVVILQVGYTAHTYQLLSYSHDTEYSSYPTVLVTHYSQYSCISITRGVDETQTTEVPSRLFPS
ncbi:uncharacterized protein [Penaeus vannamei]|uniref:uncharacterized protein n=1 Tax=Penaeus vannamei TaxID=6689 RepID=UPI00387F7FB2